MLEFEVADMTCNHCIASITKAIQAIEPNAQVQANLETHRVTVQGNMAQDVIIAALDDAGFEASPVQG